MSDQRLRELERRWRETGDVEDEAAYQRERLRCGELARAKLEAAGLLGHPAAQWLLPETSQAIALEAVVRAFLGELEQEPAPPTRGVHPSWAPRLEALAEQVRAYDPVLGSLVAAAQSLVARGQALENLAVQDLLDRLTRGSLAKKLGEDVQLGMQLLLDMLSYEPQPEPPGKRLTKPTGLEPIRFLLAAFHAGRGGISKMLREEHEELYAGEPLDDASLDAEEATIDRALRAFAEGDEAWIEEYDDEIAAAGSDAGAAYWFLTLKGAWDLSRPGPDSMQGRDPEELEERIEELAHVLAQLAERSGGHTAWLDALRGRLIGSLVGAD